MSRLEQEIISRNLLWNDNEGRLFMIRFCLDLFWKKLGGGTKVLEIGVDRGAVPMFLVSFFRPPRGSAETFWGTYLGVDPKWRMPFPLEELCDFASFIEADSASFWATCEMRFDLIYVDGCHNDDVADLDVKEAVKHLSPAGMVLVHDVRADGGPRKAFIKHCVENLTMTGFFATAENVCGSGMGIAFRKGSRWE